MADLQQIEVDESDIKNIDFNATSLSIAVEGSSALGLKLTEYDLYMLHRVLNTSITKGEGNSNVLPAAYQSDRLRFLALWAEEGRKFIHKQKVKA